ncbi:MAG: spore coat U domain-containing protein [Polaromonas sp.]|uniref:Csu type fimbrial protein n=1 Tax=Polaromonas sp. TaxID=1869339 RepID=UPI0024889061|nr:spore coat U domain-containing protein [Polaromonas sp.]MDI1238538.1 spore coat U domain-containing protein [Polaromonas sp.]
MPALAATSTSSLTVSVTVPATCHITATALAFGIYTGTVDLDPATLTITCSNTTAYTVALNAGLGANPAATVSTRHMNGPAASGLPYALFRDASRTLNWGQTIGVDTVAGRGNGSPQTLTVYGRIAAGQLVTPGSYSDTIIATITY